MNKKDLDMIKKLKELEGFEKTSEENIDTEENLESLDIPHIIIANGPMKITKADFSSRISNIGIVNVATGFPPEMEIHDVRRAIVDWFLAQGYILIPDFSEGEDYQGIEHFRKIPEETIYDVLKDDRKENELKDYIRSRATDDKILISIPSCWFDHNAKIWLATAIINDNTFSFNPRA